MTVSQLNPTSDFFKIGDIVVYPTHGVGKITEEEVQIVAGTEMSLYVILTMKGNVKIRVPKKRADKTGLRHLSSSKELDIAIDILKQSAAPKLGNWPKRSQKYNEKINSGNLAYIAEVVRDLHRNEGDHGGTSYSESVLYKTAIERLACEYALLMEVDEQTAMNKIVIALTYKI